MGTEGTDSIANGQPLKMNSSTKESMTGKVGTTLYVAPELEKRSGGRVKYSQKVDLYSLGIIFFEMCFSVQDTTYDVDVYTGQVSPHVYICAADG